MAENEKTTAVLIQEFLEEKPDPEWIRVFLERMHLNLSESSRSFHRSLVSFGLAWLVIWCIGSDIVAEGEFSVVKISKVKELLIAGPIVLAMMGYSCAVSLAGYAFFRKALIEFYRILLPAAYRRDLEILLFPTSPYDLELALARPKSGHEILAVVIFSIFPLLGPPVALAHSFYLAWVSHLWSSTAIGAAGLIALIIWARSMMLIITSRG